METENQVAELSAVISESLGQNEDTKILPVKASKKRGRKKGCTPWNKKNGSGDAAGSGMEAVMDDAQAAPPAPPMEIPAAVLVPALQLPFRIAALKTDYEGFNLETEEAETLVPSLNQVIAQYCPAVSGESAPLIVLGGSIALLAVTKYMAFMEHQNTERAKAKALATSKPQNMVPHAAAELFPVAHAAGHVQAN